MNAAGVRVVKVGGSLLEWEGLPPALNGWLQQQPAAPTVLIAGGGALADFVRDADARFGIGETTAHWLCISLMSVTARMLAGLLAEAELLSSYAQLAERVSKANSGLFVFDVEPYVQHIEPELPGDALPHTWQVTSDSIAARASETLDAFELVLLKSSDPPGDASPDELANAGYVDGHFPHVAQHLAEIRYVNLRRYAQ